MLIELPIDLSDVTVPAAIEQFALAGLRRSKEIACFDFVASSYSMVYRVLHSLPRGTWCEWGSGIGINTGIAACLGFEATGIEMHPQLAAASRELLDLFGYRATILQEDYLAAKVAADYYYVYCWPGQMPTVEEHFLAHAPESAQLLICHGAEDIRCKVKSLS